MAASGKARSGPHPMMLNLQRQIREIKRQKEGAPARGIAGAGPGAKAAAKPPAPAATPARPEGATASVGRPAAAAAPRGARLKPSSGLAIRRLGVPLRGAGAGTAAPRAAARRRPPAVPPAPAKRLRAALAAGAPSKRARLGGEGVAAALVRSTLAVKQQEQQQVISDDEDWQPLAESQAATSRAEERNAARAARPSGKDARGSNILRGLLGHLASASQRLSAERGRGTGAAVLKAKKEEPEDDGDGPGPRPHAGAEPVGLEGQEKNGMRELQKRLESHYANMKNFIRTQAEPTIFYLPVRHTPATKLALQETRHAIEQKIRSLGTHLQTELGPEDSDENYEGTSSEEDAGEERQQKATRADKREAQDSSSS